MAAVKVQIVPLLKEGEFTVEKVNELAFFDLLGNRSKTSGTSNKQYFLELNKAKSGNKAQIYSEWGATGGTQRKEWRHYDNFEDAAKDYNKIVSSKKRKGYEEIDVAQRVQGSSEALKIVKAVNLKNIEHLDIKEKPSLLHPETERLITSLMGASNKFVIETLKCPLGQLTNNQIDKGLSVLNEARAILINNGASNVSGSNTIQLSKSDGDKIIDYTNEFYALIPHNLGQGKRGKMEHLLLDSLEKIVKKEDDLDTLLDAKAVGAKVAESSSVIDKYKALNADIDYVDKDDDLFKFLSIYFEKTKVRNHGYKNSKVKNIWKVHRKDNEWGIFEENMQKVARECGGHTFVKETAHLSNNASKYWVPNKRPDLSSAEVDLYNKANVWMCWHGTRSANLIGITTRGLLVRPAGAIITGAMFGPGKYYAWQSTKSLNYTDGGYWAKGAANPKSKFMFLLDVGLGNMHLAPRAKYYTEYPNGHHSIYGKANYSGVYNDEMITLDTSANKSQAKIKYLFEIVGD